MTVMAIILILISAGLHAGWNLISKSGNPSPLYFLILTLSSATILFPFLVMNGGGGQTIPGRFWFLLTLTGFFQALYYTGLAKAYSHGDISLVYPLIRAIPVLMVPLVTSAADLGSPLSGRALAGMTLIGIGCIFIPVRNFKTWHIRDYSGPALLWVLPGAVGTTGYTIIDSVAMDLLDPRFFPLPISLVYSGFINLAILPWLMLSVSLLSGWGDGKNFQGRKILSPLIAGLAVSLSYMFVLASMKHVTNVSYVAGFRQLSIPLGVLLGGTIFKETLYIPRIIGCVFIVAGLFFTALF